MQARHHRWLSSFADLTYSCHVGVAKPDPRAYEICARRLGVPPQQVMFFDDKEEDDKEENVLAARRAGRTAEVLVSPEQVRRSIAVP